MRKNKKTLFATLLITFSLLSGCTSLPPGAPEPPESKLCTRSNRYPDKPWFCKDVKTKEESYEPDVYVQAGVSGADLVELNTYKQKLVNWAWELYNNQCK